MGTGQEEEFEDESAGRLEFHWPNYEARRCRCACRGRMVCFVRVEFEVRGNVLTCGVIGIQGSVSWYAIRRGRIYVWR